MTKHLVIIIGPHAVGKMTVGQELAKRTDLRLFHNHMSIELPRKLFAGPEKEFRVLKQVIRDTVFDLFAQGDFYGLIFTYMCAFDMKEDVDYLVDLIAKFEATGTKCHVVELCADFDVRLERNRSENRLLHKESKRNLEWSESEMRHTSSMVRLNSLEGEKLPFDDYLKIDNTHLPPEEVALLIKQHFSLGQA